MIFPAPHSDSQKIGWCGSTVTHLHMLYMSEIPVHIMTYRLGLCVPLYEWPALLLEGRNKEALKTK